MTNQNFVSTKNKVCPLCGSFHLKPSLIDRPDHEYGVSSALHYVTCQNMKCGFVYAVDIPLLGEIQGFYTKYSTHSIYHPSKMASVIRYGSLLANSRYLKSIFNGRDIGALKVLDYGCGSGDFMSQLMQCGLIDVFGYDFDPEATRCARALGMKVYAEEHEFLAEGAFDFIFLNHVIEHLIDPETTLTMLLGSLKKGGRLVLRTPNAKSFLAGFFGDNWRGWETPRHLHIFNTKTISKLVTKINAAELSIVNLTTSNAMFIGMFHESFHSGFWRNSFFGKVLRHAACFLIFPVGVILNCLRQDIGEEVVLVVERGKLV